MHVKKFSNHEEMLWNLKLRLNYNVSLSESYDFNYIYKLKPHQSKLFLSASSFKSKHLNCFDLEHSKKIGSDIIV